MEFIIRENIIPFTNINLALFILCYFKPYSNYINYYYLYSICYCWNHIIFLNIIHTQNYFLYIYCYEKLREHKILNLYL
jgi:hypothetical protein